MMEKLEQFELVVDHAKNPPTKLQILVANVMFRVHFAVVGSEPSFANFRWFSVHSLSKKKYQQQNKNQHNKHNFQSTTFYQT